MDDQKQQEERWRELAEMLGLPGDAPAPAKTEKPPEPPKVEARAIKAYEEPPALVAHTPDPMPVHAEEEAPSIPMTREEPGVGWEAEFEEDEDTSIEEQAAPPVNELNVAEEGPAGEPAVAGEEEKPRRGRRRRRRGRRRSGDGDKPEGEAPPQVEPKVIQAPVEKPAPARPPRDAETAPRDNRGRGRGPRRDEEAPRRPAPPRQAPRPEPKPEPRHEPDEAEVFENEPTRVAASHDDTDFSDWNVPSWQELISSLYRPDRDR